MKRALLLLATALLAVTLSLTLAGCGRNTASPTAAAKPNSNLIESVQGLLSDACDQSLLKRFEGTREAESSDFTIKWAAADGAEADPGWVISRRGDGCAVTYKMKLNSRKSDLIAWYIDLKTGTVRPDDAATRSMVGMFGIKPSVLK
jgi:hypothetical protein